MSATRLIIRLVLVSILIGIGVIIFRAWRGNNPDFLLKRAEQASASGNHESAQIDLQNMVTKFPEDPRGHQALAKSVLEVAKANKKPATYTGQPDALRHLMEAARLAPENLELQKEVIHVFIAGGKPADAASFATTVLAKEPDNLDALYVTMVRDVNFKNQGAKASVEKLRAAKDYRPFEVLKWAAVYYDRAKQSEALQQVLTDNGTIAAAQTVEQLNAISIPELDAMTRLFTLGMERAPDATVALTRLGQAIDTYEKMPEIEQAHLSNRVSEMMQALTRKFPAAADTSEQKVVRDATQVRIDKMRNIAFAQNVAGPLVYQQSALAAFNASNHEKCAMIVAEGLAAAEKNKGAKPHEIMDLNLLAARNFLLMGKHRQAQPFIDKLIADKDYSGWGELLAGGLNSAEGRHEKAYQHYQSAQKKLGTILLVQMGLSNACLSLGKWNEALPNLQALHKSFDSNDVEIKAWAAANKISNANLHFGEFRCYLALNNWPKAQEQLAALSGTPLALNAQAMAIAHLLNTGKREEGAAMLAAARKAAPENLVFLQLEIASLLQSGKKDEAGQLIEAAAARAPSDLPKQLLLARWKLGNKQFPEALALIEKLETQFADSAIPKILKAQTLLASGQEEQGLEAAKKLKEIPEAAAAANFLLAAIDLKNKDPKAAAAELSEAANRNPDHGMINLLQGQVAASQGDFGGAFDFAGEALDVTSLQSRARGMLLKSLLLLAKDKGPAEAEAKLEPLLKENPKDVFLTIMMADLKFKQGQFDTAMKLLDRAEELEPGKANVPYIKAGIWLQRKRLDLASQECERGVSIEPAHLPSQLLAAELNLQQGKYKSAFDHAAMVLTKSPNYVPMLLIQAQSLVGLRRANDAIALLEKAITAQPEASALYDKLLNIQYDTNQADKALATTRRGREKLPDDPTLALAEVVILCMQDKTDEAQRVAENYTRDKTEKKDAGRYLAMSQAFFRAKEYEAARDWGGQALAIADEAVKPAIHMVLGDVSLSQYELSTDKPMDVLEKAKDHFSAVVAAQPDNFIAGNNLAWILAMNFNQPEEAAKVIDQARGKATVEQMPINFIDTIAVVYRKANRLEEAQQVLERANVMYQENPLLLYQLALVQNDRQLHTAARTNLERAIQLGIPDKYKNDSQHLLKALREKAASDETPTSAPASPGAEEAKNK